MTGGTAHALGTATVLTTEPLIAPTSAVTFLVTGKALRQHHEIFVYRTLNVANYYGGGLAWAARHAHAMFFYSLVLERVLTCVIGAGTLMNILVQSGWFAKFVVHLVTGVSLSPALSCRRLV